jgi:hypothetical protein
VVAAGRLSVRPLIGAGLNPLARVGEQLFVSFLPAGSITILNYGYRLVSAIGGTVLFRSVMVVLLPRLTRVTAEGDEKAVRATTKLGLRILLVISVALTVMAIPLRRAARCSGNPRRRRASSGRARGLRGQHHRVRHPAGHAGAVLCFSTPGSRPQYAVRRHREPLVPICMLPFGGTIRRGHRRGRGVLARAIRQRGAYLVPPAARPGHPVGGDGRTRPAAHGRPRDRGVLLLGYRLLDLSGSTSRWSCPAHRGAGLVGLVVFAAVGSALRLPDLRLRASTDDA